MKYITCMGIIAKLVIILISSFVLCWTVSWVQPNTAFRECEVYVPVQHKPMFHVLERGRRGLQHIPHECGHLCRGGGMCYSSFRLR